MVQREVRQARRGRHRFSFLKVWPASSLALYLSRIPLRPRKHPLLEDDSRARLGDEGPDRAVGGNRL
jgi:hypothetical protein